MWEHVETLMSFLRPLAPCVRVGRMLSARGLQVWILCLPAGLPNVQPVVGWIEQARIRLVARGLVSRRKSIPAPQPRLSTRLMFTPLSRMAPRWCALMS